MDKAYLICLAASVVIMQIVAIIEAKIKDKDRDEYYALSFVYFLIGLAVSLGVYLLYMFGILKDLLIWMGEYLTLYFVIAITVIVIGKILFKDER